MNPVSRVMRQAALILGLTEMTSAIAVRMCGAGFGCPLSLDPFSAGHLQSAARPGSTDSSKGWPDAERSSRACGLVIGGSPGRGCLLRFSFSSC